MKVALIAGTQFFDATAFSSDWQPEPGVSDAESLIEGSGRLCYQSWTRPNPATATNEGYIRHLLDVGHLSVLEHGTATFLFEGVSRSLTHELVRHRHFSYSELSQRFENMEDARPVIPPAIHRLLDEWLINGWNHSFEGDKAVYSGIVEFLTGKGLTRKQAREAARAVLPNMTETKIVVTGNFRAWRQFIAMRATVHADAEICALAVEVLWNLQVHAPNVFGDFEPMVWSGPGSDGRTYAYSSVSAPC